LIVAEVGDFFADMLRARWVAGINKVREPRFDGVEAWLLHGSYHWLPSVAGSALLDVGPARDLLADALASEAARFSCATYESLLDAVPAERTEQALGWSLVRYYYSSFYAAHALLRLSGSAITMLSQSSVTTLNKVGGQYLGMSPLLSKGLYHVQVAAGNPSHVLLEKIGGNSGGSHEEMWRVFNELVLYVETQLLVSQALSQEAQAAVKVLMELRKQLSQKGKSNGAWLSTVRNNLNYRHDYGVWYPYRMQARTARNILNRMGRWMPGHADGYDIGQAPGELDRFVDACNVMAQLLTSSLSDLASRAPATKSNFVSRKPFRLLRSKNINV
jgi:hypothetical protein